MQGSIILYVHKLFYVDFLPKEHKDQCSKDDVKIKDFTPLVVRTISKETAFQWLFQCEYLWECIGKNVERYEQEHKRKRAEGCCDHELEETLNKRLGKK